MDVLTLHGGAVLAAGRGLGLWLLFRALAHTVGWGVTIAIMVAVALATMLLRRRRQ